MLRQTTMAACLLAAINAASAHEQLSESSEATGDGTGTAAPLVGWCETFEKWKEKGLEGYLDPSSDCPIEGECDIPDVRDDYLPDGQTPFKVIRVHILAFRADDGSDPTTSEAEIIDSMQLMNAQYAPHRIRFAYTWEWIDDSVYRYDNGYDYQMKQTYAVDPLHQCNIYIIGRGSAYGTFPWDPACLTAQGGIVHGDGLWGPPYYAVVHEMGHNLGLWHTHHGVSEVAECGVCYEQADGLNADTTGDFCSQTPPTPVNFDCDPPGGIDPCCGVEWGPTQPENYMSYGLFDPDPCWELFVHQQAGRIHCWTETVLSTWFVCVADVDGSGTVDIDDLFQVLSAWGPCDECPEDINFDGIVNIDDVFGVLAAWGPCP